MSIITTLTRAWLTRTWRPFTFTGAYDQRLPYEDCEDLGLYVHIPFCRSICGFCPYCKVPYDRDACDSYIDYLLREIHMVGGHLPGKKRATSLYFGGGTPALAAGRLGEIVAALEEHFTITQGIGVELHPEDVDVPTLRALEAAGVTKLSIGIQSFQERLLTALGRGPVDLERISESLRQVPFQTVSMDFIFALPGQTIDELKEDIDTAFSAGANHVAIYPFIDFSFARSGIPAMGKAEKRALLDAITLHCRSRGYVRTSIWTFASEEGARYSSMTRDEFLGFGCSATTLLRDQFKIDTFSIDAYRRRLDEGRLPTALTIRFTRRQRMVYYLFWAAYSTRIRAGDFEDFFGVPLKRMYGFELWLAERLGLITQEEGVYAMTLKGAFYYHYYEGYYTLAYIDRMWSVMGREAFPGSLRL